MCPGTTLNNTRGGYSFQPRSAPFYAGRDFGQRYGRMFGGGRQFTGAREKFVVLDTDEETGTTQIELSPDEHLTVSPNETGGLVITIEPIAVAEPAEPEA
jgi:hypothetical protein